MSVLQSAADHVIGSGQYGPEDAAYRKCVKYVTMALAAIAGKDREMGQNGATGSGEDVSGSGTKMAAASSVIPFINANIKALSTSIRPSVCPRLCGAQLFRGH